MRSVFHTIITLVILAAAPMSAAAFSHEKGCISEVADDGLARILTITDIDVVEQTRTTSRGPWSFGEVFRRAVATSPDAGLIAYEWLKQYHSVTSYNGFSLPSRHPGSLLSIWPFLPVVPGQGLQLDLQQSPFVLLAIVFRPDLATAGNFGEGRFVFAVRDARSATGRQARDMTVIFEFQLNPTPNLPNRRAWYRSIARLAQLRSDNDTAFYAALQKLTDEFTYPYSGTSQLRRLRSNDQLFGPGWDLREFRFSRSDQRFLLNAVERTPDISLNDPSAPLADDFFRWLRANRAQILAGDFEIPTRYRSASSFMVDDHFQWFLGREDLDPDLKQKFAEQTCNGCHGMATGTQFLHLAPREDGQESVRSHHLDMETEVRAGYLLDFLRTETCLD